jgi:hypothetical protein
MIRCRAGASGWAAPKAAAAAPPLPTRPYFLMRLIIRIQFKASTAWNDHVYGVTVTVTLFDWMNRRPEPSSNFRLTQMA